MIKFVYFLLIFSISTSLSFCNRGPYGAANKTYKKNAKKLSKEIIQKPSEQTMATAAAWVGTTNFNLRKPNIVVIHHTAQKSCGQTLNTFTTPSTSVSAHYVICEEGTVHHMLNDYFRAWHGGIGKWGNINDVNSSSIGIELDNDGTEVFSGPQINSLLLLLDTLKRKYTIPAANFISHSDIAPTRKVDPNVHFPWKQLSDRGFGLWWGDTSHIFVPQNFDHLQALRIIGYDIKDSSAAFGAFNRKYVQQDKMMTLPEPNKKILYSLYKKHI